MSGNPLKPVCIAGLILALIVSWGMVLFFLFAGKGVPGKSQTEESSFSRELKEYDLSGMQKRALEGENPDLIERRLARLQKLAGGVEQELSVLKRRRALALTDRRFIQGYAKAAREAAETYAYSAPIAAVASEAVVSAEAIIMGGASGVPGSASGSASHSVPLSENTAVLLKKYSQRLSQNRFGLLQLAVYVLAGELDNPVRAAALPGLENLLSLDFSGFPEQIRTSLLLDDFLLRSYRGDIANATRSLNVLLTGASREIVRMGAEFHYDHNNPLRAAELFLALTRGENSTERDAAMAAGALVLAGEIPGARNIWLSLSSPEVSGNTRSRSLYNLAASSAGNEEKISWLEKIFSLRSTDSTAIYSIIRYTRLLDSSHSIAILDSENLRQNPLLDLELLRRKLESWPPTRSTAEVWMLLNRKKGNEDLFEWAAWYFNHQKLFDELGRLLKEAGRSGMTGSWLNFHRGLAFLREGNTDEAEKIFREVRSRKRPSDWHIPANLGRIQEGRRAISAALEFYEEAAAMAKGQAGAAQLQMRLSRCLEALGRTREARRALESALESDPDNFDIRRELRRFDNR